MWLISEVGVHSYLGAPPFSLHYTPVHSTPLHHPTTTSNTVHWCTVVYIGVQCTQQNISLGGSCSHSVYAFFTEPLSVQISNIYQRYSPVQCRLLALTVLTVRHPPSSHQSLTGEGRDNISVSHNISVVRRVSCLSKSSQ